MVPASNPAIQMATPAVPFGDGINPIFHLEVFSGFAHQKYTGSFRIDALKVLQDASEWVMNSK
jgi:hypothetical protein